jgi:hypothetical protein
VSAAPSRDKIAFMFPSAPPSPWSLLGALLLGCSSSSTSTGPADTPLLQDSAAPNGDGATATDPTTCANPCGVDAGSCPCIKGAVFTTTCGVAVWCTSSGVWSCPAAPEAGCEAGAP